MPPFGDKIIIMDQTKQQIATIMLLHGTPKQQLEALIYLGYPHNMSKDFILLWLEEQENKYSQKTKSQYKEYREMAWAFRFVREVFNNSFC